MKKPSPNQKAWRIAFVAATWHGDIVGTARQACLRRLGELGTPPESVHAFEVPGSLEIPLVCKRLALSGQFDGVIAFGFIVNGGIYRHEFVAQAVLDGMMQVQLDTGVPIFSAVLTPINYHEHEAHHDFFLAHMVHKGTEVADACCRTLSMHDTLPAPAADRAAAAEPAEPDNGNRRRHARGSAGA